MLAGLLKAPSRYAPTRSVSRATARIDEVLGNMVEAGFLTPAEAREARLQPLKLRPMGDETGFPYAVDWVAEQLPDCVGEPDGDLIVETTIDAGLQRVAQQTLRQELDSEGASLGAGEGAVVVLDTSGAVQALVGGRSYRTSPFDRAVKALRQPGSAFKPFVYLTALEAGYTPDSVADDEPIDHRRLVAQEPYRHLSRRGQLARQPRPVDQHGGGEARGRRRTLARDPHGAAARHPFASSRTRRRSRSAPPRSRCSS